MENALAANVTSQFGDRIAVYLVIPDPTRLASPAIADHWLVDALHLLHRRYGVTDPAFYLLRPDTYVAARGPTGDAGRLLVDFNAIFQPA